MAGLETLEVKGQLTRIYHYANPVRRVVLRNVPPFLGDNILISKLSEFGYARSEVIHQTCFGLGESFSVQIGAKKCFKCGKAGHINKDCPNVLAQLTAPQRTKQNANVSPEKLSKMKKNNHRQRQGCRVQQF